MSRTTRRKFVQSTLAGGASLLAAHQLSKFPLAAATPDSRIEVLIDEPIGVIAPEIYGHFVEHLGGVVYDGIWVGEGSKIANTGGIRQALVDAMKRIKPSVARWPGGCFADSYNWRDGLGARAGRPRRANFWVDAPEWPKGAPDGPWKYDPNHFGTNEFLRFCQLTGAQGYLAANLRSLSRRRIIGAWCIIAAITDKLTGAQPIKAGMMSWQGRLRPPGSNGC